MDTIVGGLRWVVVVLGAYLVASVVASAAVHRLRLGRAVRVVDVFTLPPVRRLVRAAAGAGVAAGALVGSAPAGGAGTSTDGPVPMPVMRRLGDGPPPTMRATPAPPPTPTPAPAPTTAEWTVRPGDHFWRIAEEMLTKQLQRDPSDAETDPYWRRLVAVNRDRLADHDNPDLLFPGQVLLVPPTS